MGIHFEGDFEQNNRDGIIQDSFTEDDRMNLRELALLQERQHSDGVSGGQRSREQQYYLSHSSNGQEVSN